MKLTIEVDIDLLVCELQDDGEYTKARARQMVAEQLAACASLWGQYEEEYRSLDLMYGGTPFGTFEVEGDWSEEDEDDDDA